MNKPIYVKEIIDLIVADRIEIVEMHHFVGKGSAKIGRDYTRPFLVVYLRLV